MATPVDAANPDAAHAFLNYLMEPEVIAGVSNAVVAATQFVDEKIRNDPDLYPTPKSCSGCVPTPQCPRSFRE